MARALLSLAITALEAAVLAWALGGLGALASHPRALALVACWALAGVTLAWRRPARTRDTLALVPEGRLLLVSLGLLPLAIPPLSALTERLGLWMLPGGAAFRWAGVAISASGLAVRIAAMTRLGARFAPTLALQPEHALETGGLYARIRHPGYLGAWLAALGAALAFGSATGLAAALLFGTLMAARARREEALLERHFGEAWRDYRARTGAFLPRWGG